MAKKLQLSVLCGGESTEHEISILSTKNIVAALDKDKYNISVVYITEKGEWFLLPSVDDFLHKSPQEILKSGQAEAITAAFGDSTKPWQSSKDCGRRYPADCVFPVLHGTFGEDGRVQALMDLLHLAYVGPDAQSSAACMEKDITKRMLRSVGLPTSDWHVIGHSDPLEGLYDQLSKRFGKEVFVKPACLGSAVASVPVRDDEQFKKAVKEALRYDERAIVEPRIRGREIECAVLGNGDPKAALPGEIVLSGHDYYSYEAKYLDPQGARTEIPAKLSPDLIKKVQALAIKAYKVMHCEGMTRVDFFVVSNEEIYINELNPIPGFTNISMYPKMWEASGLSYSQLLDKLIELALERNRFRQSLTRIYRHS